MKTHLLHFGGSRTRKLLLLRMAFISLALGVALNLVGLTQPGLFVFVSHLSVMVFSAAGAIYAKKAYQASIRYECERNFLCRAQASNLAFFESRRGQKLSFRQKDHFAQVEEWLVGRWISIADVLAGLFAILLVQFLRGTFFIEELILATVGLALSMLLRPAPGSLKPLRREDDSLKGIRTLRNFGAEAYLLRRFDQKAQETQRRIEVEALKYLYKEVLWFVMMIFVAGFLGLHGKGPILFAMSMALCIGIRLILLSVLEARAHYFPLIREFTLSNENTGDANAMSPIEFSSADGISSLLVRDLVYETTSGKLVGPVSFSLERGRVVSVEGPPGIGKSNLLEVLSGLRRLRSGNFVLADRTGRVIYQGEDDQFIPASLCAFVERVPYFIDGSIRENLTLGNSARSSDAVLWGVLERVGLYTRIVNLGGLDSPFDSEKFADGEKYLLTIARALMLRRPFLLLDEPFSSLSQDVVAHLERLLNEFDEEVGTVLVSHVWPQGFHVDENLRIRSNGQVVSDGEPKVVPWISYPALPRLI